MEESRQLEYRGCAFRYYVDGNGPPVVFIEGVGVSASGWRPQIAELSSSYRCLSFDNRGLGRSQPADPRLSVDQMADDTRALMDAEGWPSAHVVGHSLGGLIALSLALKFRDRVRSVSLLCTFADGRVPFRLSPRMVWVGCRLRIGTRSSRRGAFLEMVMPRALLAHANRADMAAKLAPIFGHDLADQPPVAASQLRAMRAYNTTPRLGELAGLPTLVVSASEDILAPPDAGMAIARGVPGARFVEIPDAAHGLPIHSPAIVNALLREHWSGAELRV